MCGCKRYLFLKENKFKSLSIYRRRIFVLGLLKELLRYLEGMLQWLLNCYIEIILFLKCEPKCILSCLHWGFLVCFSSIRKFAGDHRLVTLVVWIQLLGIYTSWGYFFPKDISLNLCIVFFISMPKKFLWDGERIFLHEQNNLRYCKFYVKFRILGQQNLYQGASPQKQNWGKQNSGRWNLFKSHQDIIFNMWCFFRGFNWKICNLKDL